MYKRLTFKQLTTINTNFFKNIQHVMHQKKHTFFKGFLRETMQESDNIYYFKSGRPLLRIQHFSTAPTGDPSYRLVDEQDKIELLTDDDGINQIHNLLKNQRQVTKISTDNKTILENLFDELLSGELQYIHQKPFVTYDIETTRTGEQLEHQHFEMAYSTSTDDLTKGIQYQYIDRTSMHRYCDYLLEYPGWIIGYNQIGFDNPVLIHNVGYGQTELDILNQKSIDPFLILWKLLKKRLKLTKVAESLVSMGKTLDSGAEGSKLLQEYKQTGDPKTLKIVKKYCKNDVKITLGVFLYLIKHQKVHIEGDTKTISLDEMINLSIPENLTHQQEKRDAGFFNLEK